MASGWCSEGDKRRELAPLVLEQSTRVVSDHTTVERDGVISVPEVVERTQDTPYDRSIVVPQVRLDVRRQTALGQVRGAHPARRWSILSLEDHKLWMEPIPLIGGEVELCLDTLDAREYAERLRLSVPKVRRGHDPSAPSPLHEAPYVSHDELQAARAKE